MRLSELLPAGFQFRDINAPQTVRIAPLPSYLDTVLENQPDSNLAQLLSQEYLQFAYSRLLREQGASLDSADREHPMWKNLVDAMRCDGVVKAPDGLSRTILGHIKQYATALTNHWDGASYGKLLQAVLRILLRVHLAPQREKAYKEKAKELAKRKAEEVAQKSCNWLSVTQTKWKTAHLLDKVVVAQEENKPQLAQSLLRQLFRLGNKGAAPPQTQNEANDDNMDMELNSSNDQIMTSTDVVRQEAPDPLVTKEYDDELERILLTDLEADFDEIDEAFEEAMRDGESTVSHLKEPSRARLRSLEAVLKMLIESPSINSTIDANYVGKQAHKGQTFTQQECRVVAYLANTLRPFVAKRRLDDDGVQAPLAHVTTRAPFMVLGNALLRATGYHPFTKTICPLVSPSSTLALLLGAPGVYETLCSPTPGHFDIQAAEQGMLTNVNKTTSSANKRAIFGSFFDLDKVDSLCASHGLEFANR